MKKNGKAYNAISAYITKLNGIINKEKIEAEKKKREKQVKLDTKQSDVKPDTKKTDTKQSDTKSDTKKTDTKQSDTKSDTKQSVTKLEYEKIGLNHLKEMKKKYEKKLLNHLEEMKKINDIDEFKEKILI